MDKNEDQVETIRSKTLLIRHLPAELSQDEKEDLLKYFGAETVRVFSNRGRLVGCASQRLHLLKCIQVAVQSELAFSISTETCSLCHLQ